jgi:hypothetical protein
MTFHAMFVPGGVYLRTSAGELIGRLDKPGEPFETLEEARNKSEWLEMAVQFYQAQRQRDLGGMNRSIAARDTNGGNERPASGSAQTYKVQSVNDRGVNYE